MIRLPNSEKSVGIAGYSGHNLSPNLLFGYCNSSTLPYKAQLLETAR